MKWEAMKFLFWLLWLCIFIFVMILTPVYGQWLSAVGPEWVLDQQLLRMEQRAIGPGIIGALIVTEIGSLIGAIFCFSMLMED